MGKEAVEESAQKLSNSTTKAGIYEWLRGWKDMQPNHEQYHLRADQIAIGERAIEL